MITMPITLIAVTTATLWDLKTNRIPNLITLPIIVFALIINFYYSGFSGLGFALAGLAVGTLLLFIPFALGGMGAGDVKLLAAIGALNGTAFVLYTFLYSAIAGGVIAILIAIVRGQLYHILFNVYWAFRNLPAHIFRLGQRKDLMPITSGIRYPYGIAFLIGAIISYWVR